MLAACPTATVQLLLVLQVAQLWTCHVITVCLIIAHGATASISQPGTRAQRRNKLTQPQLLALHPPPTPRCLLQAERARRERAEADLAHFMAALEDDESARSSRA